MKLSLDNMSKGRLTILLIGSNAILALLFLIPNQELPSVFQFLGRLHPLILHFPIVLLIAAFLFELLNLKNGNSDFEKPAEILLWSGAFTGVITAVAGFLLSLNGEFSGNSFIFHKWFGLATSFASMCIVFLNQKQIRHKMYIPFYCIVIMLIVITGHFGATLTHGEGFLTEVFDENKELALNQDALIFDEIIAPILEAKCTSCHNENKLKGELLLTSAEGILKGGESGKILVGGNTEESLLIKNVLLPHEEKGHMPPKGKSQLSNEEIKMLTWWVAEGASFTQNVSEILTEDPIQITLTNYFTPEEKINIDFVSSLLIESLNTETTAVSQISTDMPYLAVRIGYKEDLEANDLKKLRKIRRQIYTLDLGNSNIDKSIINEITSFKNLNRLYLDNTNVDDELVGTLSKMRSLEYLNLYGTEITKRGAETLIKLPQLKQLYLWQTNITLVDINSLQVNFPDIEINGGLPENSEFTRAQLVPPVLNFSSSFFEDQMTIEIDYSLSDTEIYYQLDNEPLTLVQGGKIDITKSAKLRLIAQKDGWEDSTPIEQVFIKVVKADYNKVKLAHQPKGEYLGNGVATLFDLDKGSENFRDGKWLGFNGDDLILDVDLKKSKTLSSVFISTMDDLGSWIFPPNKIEIWGGIDANNLVKLTEEKFRSPEGPEPKIMQIHQLKFAAKEIKHLQIRAINYGILPDWHPGKGNKTWLFIDEVAFE